MLGIKLESAIGFTTQELAKLKAALDLLKIVVNDIRFEGEVKGFTFQGKKQFYQNKGLTNVQIYEKIMSGAEVRTPTADSLMNLNLQIYNVSWYQRFHNNVVGYTNPSTGTIFMNRTFFQRFKLNEIAANVMHEWTHKLGFDHDFNATINRPYSVPYGIQSIVTEIGDEILTIK